MLLREIVEKQHFSFVDQCEDWRDSIRKSCEPLKADQTVSDLYEDEIIECVEKHGAYLVVLPGICIPHSTEGAKGALKTAIGFMKSEKPVVFDPSDPEKYATVFLTLVANNKEEHMRNMKKLFRMLTNETFVNDLLKVKNSDDLCALDDKYFPED